MQHLTTLLLLAGITFAMQAQTDCGLPHDINNNGSVDIEDFLSILGLFGDQDSDGDGVYDSLDNCIDLESCNFMDPEALACFTADVIGDCNGDCLADEDGDGVCDPHICGNPVSYQGYLYSTVLIGDQCWFSENLRSELYLNGDSIFANLSHNDWQNATFGAVAVYGEGEEYCSGGSQAGDACDEFWSLSEYGRLYNFYAVADGRALCPSGWHVPSDSEWNTMEIAIGLNYQDANDLYWRGTNHGLKIKATYGWNWDSNGNNLSGFTGLPGGYRNLWPNSAGTEGYWWTRSTQNSEVAYVRKVSTNGSTEGQVWRGYISKSIGHSVRCIRDID